MGNTINVQGSYIDIHDNETVTSCAPSVELLPLSGALDTPNPMPESWERTHTDALRWNEE